MMKLILAVFLLFGAVEGQCKYISIKDLSEKGKLYYTLTSTGTYSGFALDLHLENKTSDTLWLTVEPGRRMLSSDTTRQDLLVVKSLQAVLPPRARKDVQLFAFCCEATNGAPPAGLAFKVGPMADENMVRMAQLINRSDFPTGAIQSAVWVLSDGHAVSSVTSEPQSAVFELRKFLSDLRGEQVPWYMVSFVSDTASVFTGKHKEIMGEVEFVLRSYGNVTISVRDEKGRVMAIPEKGRHMNQGEHKVNLRFSVLNWPKGNYDIFIHQDQVLNQRKTFSL